MLGRDLAATFFFEGRSGLLGGYEREVTELTKEEEDSSKQEELEISDSDNIEKFPSNWAMKALLF